MKMGLRDIGARLPPGFRFYPSDEELVCHYLYKKVANEEALKPTSLVEIDLHTCEPWQLPEVAKLNNTEWYFFSFRDRKYATGFRTNRATTSGYWKATGKDRVILDPRTRKIVGMRKTLVFYQNRAPNGIKTGWIMHEFRLESPNMPPKEDWVLCRVFHKSKVESNNANNNMQIMVDHQIISAGKTTNSSPPPPFNSATSAPPPAPAPAPAPAPPPPPPPPPTPNWGLSSSTSCQKQEDQEKPTKSLISSNTIPPPSTSQKQPHNSNAFISSSPLNPSYQPHNNSNAFISSSPLNPSYQPHNNSNAFISSFPLNPSYHGEKDDEHLIIKVASSNNLFSLSDLINSNAINDDVYGFLWDMDLDQGSSIAHALDDGVLISLPPLPEPNHSRDHKDMGKVGFDDANHLL